MTTLTQSEVTGLPRSASLAQVVDFCNRLLTGRMNATASVTLAQNAATTTLNDPRLGYSTFIGFCPLTAHAAAEIASGNLYVSAQSKGTATLTHTNNAQSDRTFRLIFIG